MTDDQTIDADAVLWSASPADREGRPLLLLLHGYGSHEGDLFGLAAYLPLEPVIASLRAPLRASWPVDGNSWYPLDLPGDPSPVGVTGAARAVLDWIDALDVQPTSIGLLGFSQGGSLTLQLMRLAPERFSYGVVLSGFVASGEVAGDADLAVRKPPVFWGRGTTDQVIPEAAVFRTTDWLPSHSTLSGRIYEGLGHSVSEQELADIRAFIDRQL
ncbi:alpha/beta hydrolase [Plantibacter sp. Mn2098]|uniref:alpha/beta hydrolase n=1 Tax=Plantibacter sp. Mn2098 TaxID=3395266 RepID=UPI003BC4F0FC